MHLVLTGIPGLFTNGTRRLFDFINDNPLVVFYVSDWNNDQMDFIHGAALYRFQSCG